MFWRSRGFGKGWVMLECTYYLNGKEFWIFAYLFPFVGMELHGTI